MMASGSARQTKGSASVALCSAMNRLMAVWRSTTEWNAVLQPAPGWLLCAACAQHPTWA